ncbi:MAG TPA: metallophosphoesterase [Terriglobales bacterium]|nr:metallophosphoesterase [Terriglobales bacterium]
MTPASPIQSSATSGTTEKPIHSSGIKWKAAALVVLAAFGFYGVLVEPYRIEVTHFDIQGAVASPLKIAHLSDLHTRGIGRREQRLLAVLDSEKPDVILITGDTVARKNRYDGPKELYTRLHAPLGVWVVRGNWENDSPLHHERAFYQDAGVHFLLNENAELRPDVWLIGLDDPYTGVAKLDVAMAGAPSDAYKIALFHSPAFFDRIAGHVNLCLAGHTHGGQVRLPFMNPLWLPRGSGRFLAGWYQENGSEMYVNRGLGWSLLPVRFLARPEITFITIHP